MNKQLSTVRPKVKQRGGLIEKKSMLTDGTTI